MGQEAVGVAGHGVVAQKDGAIEGGVEPLDHAQRFDRTLDVGDPRIQLGVEEVLVVSVGIVHQDLGPGVSGQDRLDHDVHLIRGELSPRGVVLPR